MGESAGRILENAPDSFALAGFSLGGIVALEMVAQAPGRVTRLALLDTTARPDPEANHAVRRNAVTRAAQMGVDRYVSDKLWSLYVSGDHRADGAIRATIVDMSARTGLAAFASQSEIAIHRADSRPRLGVIAMPTLVLCGEDDRLCPVEVHREMADAIVGADLVVVPRSWYFRASRTAGRRRRRADRLAGPAGRTCSKPILTLESTMSDANSTAKSNGGKAGKAAPAGGLQAGLWRAR